MANVEDFLESINYAPVDVRRNFHLIKDLQAMEERLEKLLCGKQHQMKILMEMDSSREKDVLLQGLKEDIQRLHLQLLALHRERINAAETVQLMFQKYSKQLDSEFEKFIDELRSLPQEQDDGLIRKSTREIVKQDNYVKTGVVSKKRKPDVDIITEDPQNKPYCLCQRPSYGVMVACDNSVCRFEWFHMDCVGLVELPSEKQKWFCPDCDGSRNIM